MAKAGQLTPMLRHYLEVKEQHRDAVLLYRMGDFYEIFFEDAFLAAPILEVTLTARQKGTENEAPMCGVPHHALEVYLGKLIRAGLKVAICDQMEDPSEAKGLVRREVTRVVTPGTLSDPELLRGKENSFLGAVVWQDGAGGGAFLDVSTGSFSLCRWVDPEEALEELKRRVPRELLHLREQLPEDVSRWAESRSVCLTVPDDSWWLSPRASAELLERQLQSATLRGFDLDPEEPAVRAAAAVLAYARETQKSDLEHVRRLAVQQAGDAMVLDTLTLANLEVFRTLRGGDSDGTLLWLLDRTVTAAGGRLLRQWLRAPLLDPGAIDERLDAVQLLTEQEERREDLRGLLSGSADLERLLTRAVLGTLRPREAAALRETLERVPEIFEQIQDLPAALLQEIAEVEQASGLLADLQRILEKEPPAALKEGGAIRSGVDPELDRLRSLTRDSKRHLLALEREEREKTGIGSLKVRFNKVFGYYLEVTKANLSAVPERYIRKQTLVNAERFITPELKELEEQLLSAEERLLALEAEHFDRLRRDIVESGPILGPLAEALARLDVISGFADLARRYDYVRPSVEASGRPIVIREGRHPVVERLGSGEFVPNDTELNGEEHQIVVLTGPNMGGKSTYLRQTALIVLLAQTGCFVPARAASIGVVDRIFTRVGASDDLRRGESTFMTEMIETAKILHQSGPRSLVILDEVGRGTATFDGLSLAWAIVEFLHEHRRPLTLFATHYHELTELAALLPRVVNLKMAVKEWEDRIVFLHKVIPGSADKSYGLHVAKLAGVPAEVVERAAEVLGNLEAQEYDARGRPRLAKGSGLAEGRGADQMTLFAPAEEIVAGILREVDLERLSPLAALNLLQTLKSRLGG